MEIKIDGRNIIMSGIKRYRSPEITIALSYVTYGGSIAYVVTYHDPVFFNSLAEALKDLSTTLHTDEMSKLLQCLS